MLVNSVALFFSSTAHMPARQNRADDQKGDGIGFGNSSRVCLKTERRLIFAVRIANRKAPDSRGGIKTVARYRAGSGDMQKGAALARQNCWMN